MTTTSPDHLTAAIDLDAELDILHAILDENTVLFQLPFLQADHFAGDVYRQAFSACETRISRGEKVTLTLLAADLGRDAAKAILRRVGICTAPADTARHLVELSNIRRLLDACHGTLTAYLREPGVTFAELAGDLTRTLQDATSADGAKRQRRDDEVTSAILEKLKAKTDPTSTGLHRLDGAMGGGLFPGRSYGFAARKKVGKTILASTISWSLNQRNVPHLFIAAEMGAEEIHERNIARAIHHYPSAFRDSHRDSPAFLAKVADVGVRSNRCIVYQDAPGLTFDDLRRYVASAIHTHKIQGFILDYWQLVGGKAKGKNATEHLDEVAQWIADFCRKHGVWSITMAQINQDGNTRGGEGIRLAFDQVYHLKAMGENEDITIPERWLEMMDTRYTKWAKVGDVNEPGLFINEHGPYFEEAGLSVSGR